MTTDAGSAAPSDGSRKGWIVVGALFLMLSIVITGRNSLGLMMPFWKEDLGWSYRFVSTAGAVMLTVMAIGAPVVGIVLDRMGSRIIYAIGMTLVGLSFILCAFMTEPWQLIALFGVLGGIGFAALSPSLVSTTVARHFDKKLGVATGIATSGSTGGQFALMPLFALLITAIAWRQSFLVAGVLVLATAVVVFFLIGDQSAERWAAGGVRTSTLGVTLRLLAADRTFWLLSGGFFICGFTTAGVIKIHLIPYAISCGFPPLESATAYGVMSLFSLVGMIVAGYLSDRFDRPLLLAVIYLLRAFTFVLLIYIGGSSSLLFTFAVVNGLFDYASFPIVASLVATHIGRHIMGITMGLIFAAHSIGGAMGSYLGGYMFDVFARYDGVWITSFILAAMAAVLTILIHENRETPGRAVPVPA